MEKKLGLFPQVSNRLRDSIINHKSVAIISHINPDGDAAFSSLALKSILISMDKEVRLFNDGPFKRREIENYENEFSSIVDDEFKSKSPLVIILDCSTEDRAGNVYSELKRNETIVIDHHSSGTPFYEEDLSYIVPHSPSTTLLVDEVRIALGVPLTKESAEYLMLGFLTDTGFFHFINSEQAPESFKKVSSFVDTGINPYELYDRLHDGRKLEDIKAVSKIIEEAESIEGGKILLCYERESLNCSERPGDMVYSTLLEAENVKVVVLLKERGDDTEFGFRAKLNANIDVGALAHSIGGGGHKLAAGATVKGVKIEDAKSFILERLIPLVK